MKSAQKQKNFFAKELSRISGVKIQGEDLDKDFWSSVGSEVIPFIKEEKIKLYQAQSEERLKQESIRQKERVRKRALDKKYQEIDDIQDRISKLERKIKSKAEFVSILDADIKADKKGIGGMSFKSSNIRRKKENEAEIDSMNKLISEYKNQLVSIEKSLKI